MLHALLPFRQLTRSNAGVIPTMRVIRRPFITLGVTVAVGEKLPVDLILNQSRIRQLYESRLIEPMVAPKNTRQEAIKRAQQATRQAPAQRANPPASIKAISGKAGGVMSDPLLSPKPARSSFADYAPARVASKKPAQGQKPKRGR